MVSTTEKSEPRGNDVGTRFDTYIIGCTRHHAFEVVRSRPLTALRLSPWAENKIVIDVDFYFWISGFGAYILITSCSKTHRLIRRWIVGGGYNQSFTFQNSADFFEGLVVVFFIFPKLLPSSHHRM